jgi:hypothetical protein
MKFIYMEPGQLSTGYRLDDRGFDSRQTQDIFLYFTAPTAVPGPTKTSIQWVSGTISLGVKRLKHEANHSPPSRVEVKNSECILRILPYVFMA